MPAASAVFSLLTFFGPCKESQSPVGARTDGFKGYLMQIEASKTVGSRPDNRDHFLW
jgi:hypothetical protein